MKPTTDELIMTIKLCLKYKSIDIEELNSYHRLQGRLDVLEEWDSLEQYEFQSKWIKEEIAKIKEVLK